MKFLIKKLCLTNNLSLFLNVTLLHNDEVYVPQVIVILVLLSPVQCLEQTSHCVGICK